MRRSHDHLDQPSFTHRRVVAGSNAIGKNARRVTSMDEPYRLCRPTYSARPLHDSLLLSPLGDLVVRFLGTQSIELALLALHLV